MAKSLRSKSKRSFRSKKRETGKYAAAEAARLNRVHTKLASVKSERTADVGEEEEEKEEERVDEDRDQPPDAVTNLGVEGEKMSLDEPDQKPTPVSTHGTHGSRREEWRKSKGMDPFPKRRGMNRQGGLAARRKPGRPSRRR